MRTYIKFLPGLIVLLFACKASNNSAGNNKAGVIYSNHFKKPIIDKGLYAATTEVVGIDSAYISGDSLNIITPKITGCDADNFRLMWNGVFSKAKPAQTTVKIFEAVDPACKAKNKFHLSFNIKPLRQKPDSLPNKSVVIRFGNYKPMLQYNY
jgi:hypothetical protein